ncbi:hypothetical protein J437_LFUL015280 [Ladona fulva]|uniref:Golgi SNAP receptor complex member 1 n=1 Tax=Ladona fulva TaxID=123851 RepID=A0A8K0KRV6_LADFU|nr:hypothetical protein J437_LFUL015280 [Ladona fulva]
MEVSSVINSWEDLRKQARKLENEIDLKLVSFNKLGAGHSSCGFKPEGEKSLLIDNDQVFLDSQEDLERLLSKLSNVNEKMGDFSTGQALYYTRERHKEVLQEYNREFQKIKANYQCRRERENLLNSVRKDIDNYKSGSGLNRRMDLYLKENEHIRRYISV